MSVLMKVFLKIATAQEITNYPINLEFIPIFKRFITNEHFKPLDVKLVLISYGSRFPANICFLSRTFSTDLLAATIFKMT